MNTSGAEKNPIRKIIVAVHGIGDQSRNATALATTIRFCDHFNYPGMVSLGSFYGTLSTEDGGARPNPALFLPTPPIREKLTGVMGFAEVHWADIPRRIDQDKYTLQETKAWALTIVNRVRVLAADRNARNEQLDYSRIRLVLQEMIEAIAVIESLLFLSRKAGLFDFDLGKILNGFLGDVQIVTEFPAIRAEIVTKFHRAMDAIHTLYPEAEIYLVAHSEGTVVSLLGLLEGCDNPAGHPWINQVCGLMTMGSPIDKHLILWPDLFKRFMGPGPIPAGQERIRWLNYVDYSDPVGFNLDTAREWIARNGYNARFEFRENDDYSFRRYPFPGKAHVDYWGDPDVFAHFIRKVVSPEPLQTWDEAEFLIKGPPNKRWVCLVTYGVSYLVPLGIIHLGVYILLKAISAFLTPGQPAESSHFIACVLGLSWLLCGTTVWLRLVRLTRHWGWFALGLTLYALFAVGFLWVTRESAASATELNWFSPVGAPTWLPTAHPGVMPLITSAGLIAVILILNSRIWRRFRTSSRDGR